VKIGVAGTTTGVSGFDSAVKGKVRRWKFEKIKSGNTTVTIPFTFKD
jgi:outer membrane biosynthesis protein TonB